jgi:hypothetical protein
MAINPNLTSSMTHHPDLTLFTLVWVLFIFILIRDFIYPAIVDLYVKFQVYKKNGFYVSYMEYIKGVSDQQPYKALRIGLSIVRVVIFISITLLLIVLYINN